MYYIYRLDMLLLNQNRGQTHYFFLIKIIYSLKQHLDHYYCVIYIFLYRPEVFKTKNNDYFFLNMEFDARWYF